MASEAHRGVALGRAFARAFLGKTEAGGHDPGRVRTALSRT